MQTSWFDRFSHVCPFAGRWADVTRSGGAGDMHCAALGDGRHDCWGGQQFNMVAFVMALQDGRSGGEYQQLLQSELKWSLTMGERI